ncbi:MAG: DUF2344 domain-containing protein [bacterium]|nr:DUF2344 domain-containing protein [bacterium]
MSVVRLRLARGGPVRHWSHREYVDAVHEAVDRAGLPVVRGTGRAHRYLITPGPPLTPGHGSRCEYVDFELAGPMTAAEFGKRLERTLPDGLHVLWQRPVPRRSAHLRAAVRAFRYAVRTDVSPEKAEAFERAETWPLTRVRKNRERRLDLKRSVSGLRVEPGCVSFTVEVRDVGTPKVEEVMASIFGIAAQDALALSTERVDCELDPAYPQPPLDME